ncbi:FAS-associated factor 2-like [Pollicipes pollicipes]|uniref:FAS-associated factor 2-like n=1 Tax=Pollicipes pollicipes TaxID=41117 RepID=UPI00188595DB|nr:FAS-associated factor 2-like [Pollicipes pollicipes]XP_037074685.1 FAS-associated factor 2-like [Pollicipes pollicipes]
MEDNNHPEEAMFGDITEAQHEMLLQFQDLTGADRIEWCRGLLEEHDWNLDAAARSALNMPSAETDRPARPRRPTDAVVPAGEGGLFSWLFSLATLPLRYIMSTLSGIINICLSIIRGGGPHDPVEDVSGFITEFESAYGSEHPAFLRCSYSQALAAAKQQLRPLAVYLHCADHQDTAAFCRETLRHRPLAQYADGALLCWACSVDRPEGYRVSQALRENGYPFVAVIVLKENKMTVVGRLEGPCPPEVFLQRLQRIVSDNEASLVAARLERNERNLNQEIRQQQDVAYEESLRADQEKERRRQLERDRLEREERERCEQERQRQLHKEEIARQKIELASEIPDEPALDRPDCVRISIKLPDGSRIERRFSTAHSLKVLYYVVFCHPDSPERFEITQNYPRRVLPCRPGAELDPPTLAEAGLGKSELLYVRDLDA